MKSIIDKKQLDEIKTGEKPVILILRANWCPDCLFLDSFIDDLTENFDSVFDSYNLDTTKFPDFSGENNISGIPSFLALKEGTEIGRFEGRQRKQPKEIETFYKNMINLTNQ